MPLDFSVRENSFTGIRYVTPEEVVVLEAGASGVRRVDIVPTNVTVATVPKPGMTSSRPAFRRKERERKREGGNKERDVPPSNSKRDRERTEIRERNLGEREKKRKRDGESARKRVGIEKRER